MHRTLRFIFTLLGIGGLLAACKGPKQPDDKRPIQYLTDGPGGGELGQNGLLPDTYHYYKQKLEERMADTLTSSPGGVVLNTGFDAITNTMSITDADTLIKDAMSCAVNNLVVTHRPAATPWVTTDAYVSTLNNSLLNNAKTWQTAGLANSVREDLHACMATRLNPSGQTVTIWLGGGNTNSDTANHTQFRIEEALWATVDSGIKSDQNGHDSLYLAINVWPFDVIEQSCPESTGGRVAAVNTRVCGTLAPMGTCGLTQRGWHECYHDSVTDSWSCPRFQETGCTCDGFGKPSGCGTGNSCQKVIETRLSCKDWCTFYPGCKIPVGCPSEGEGCKLQDAGS